MKLHFQTMCTSKVQKGVTLRSSASIGHGRRGPRQGLLYPGNTGPISAKDWPVAWEYNCMEQALTTVNQVANETDQQPSGGVFLKQNDQLVSWVMGYVPNGLSRLNTLEHHRRRGFAALAIKYMVKRMAQYGCPPFGDVLEASRKLFASLGFRKTQPAHHFSKFP